MIKQLAPGSSWSTIYANRAATIFFAKTELFAVAIGSCETRNGVAVGLERGTVLRLTIKLTELHPLLQIEIGSTRLDEPFIPPPLK